MAMEGREKRRESGYFEAWPQGGVLLAKVGSVGSTHIISNEGKQTGQNERAKMEKTTQSN